MNDFYILVLCAAFMFGGVYYLQQGLRLNRQLAASAQWPSVQGLVLQSESKKRLTTPGRQIRNSHVFYALISYRYEVCGNSYTGEVVELGGRLRATQRQIHDQVAQYPSGAAATVYYNPQDPREACLLRQGPGGWMSILGGSGFALLGAYLMIAELV
jgi:hypothetical protein